MAKPSLTPIAATNSSDTVVATEISTEEEEGEKKALVDCPRPDLQQMLPFRPRANPREFTTEE